MAKRYRTRDAALIAAEQTARVTNKHYRPRKRSRWLGGGWRLREVRSSS